MKGSREFTPFSRSWDLTRPVWLRSLRPVRVSLFLPTLALTSLLAACGQGSVETVEADTPSTARKSSRTAAKPIPDIEFIGISSTADHVTVVLLDHRTELRHRIGVGQTVADITVLSYDEENDQISVRSDGQSFVLGLRQARFTPPPLLADASIDSSQAGQLTEAMTAAHLSLGGYSAGSAPVEMSAEGPETEPAKATRLAEEREARMMVSDILEISQLHAKAYREMKAAEEAAGRGEPVFVP